MRKTAYKVGKEKSTKVAYSTNAKNQIEKKIK